jgi:hypothetical protein
MPPVRKVRYLPPRPKTRVFVSFDFDHDAHLARLIAGQAKLKDSPFEIADWSLKEAAPALTWQIQAEWKIKRANVVLVLVGKHTHKAPGVLKEVAIAKRNKIRIVSVNGYSGTVVTPVPGAGRPFKWTWPNLKLLLAPPPKPRPVVRPRVVRRRYG